MIHEHWCNPTINSRQVDFRTPEYLFNYIKSFYGRIDYDAACENGVNNLAEAIRLEDTWPNDKIIYSNPPFDTAAIIEWINKGHRWVGMHQKNVHIILIPNKCCTKKLTKHFQDKIQSFIFLGGRVNFDSIYSVPGGSSRNGSVILIQCHWRNAKFMPIQFIELAEVKNRFNLPPIR